MGGNNQLTCLNLKNGKNTNINLIWLLNNPNLTCIDVDNSLYSQNNWNNTTFFKFEPQVFFNNNCNSNCIVGINKQESTNFSFYPNPTSSDFRVVDK